MPWSPERYEAFADARLRPALDLLARIPLQAPARIADLGCGTGNVTLHLAERWPDACITGFDSSAEMLESARKRSATIEWQLAGLDDWQAREPYDLVYSNAALHWLDRHEQLFPRLLGAVAPGGALAVQMPRNFAAPSHTLALALAARPPYAAHLAAGLRAEPVHAPEVYYALLAPQARRLDIWETEYLQILEGENPVADWTRSTLLVPLLDALPHGLRSEFEAEYRRRVAQHYRKRADGRTLYPFRRLFLVALAA